MIIITADDYGKNKKTTDSILKCYSKKRITSASAMVFMQDSERAATQSHQLDLEVGLHLNFSEPFDAGYVPSNICEHQNSIVSYFKKGKFTEVIYNPQLRDSFKILFQAQLKEFLRLYGKQPDFINGHHHMHLCSNVLAGRLIPKNTIVRRTFTFVSGEKNLFNLLYRRFLYMWVSRSFISTDCFFSIEPIQNYDRLRNLFKRAAKETIEIEVHPENVDEYEFLLSLPYLKLINAAHRGGFRELNKK